MSAHRCEHGNVVSDTVGEHRCYECEPIGPADIDVRDRRIEELERVVAELCDRNGLIFRPGGVE